jgi:hypothetical protein
VTSRAYLRVRTVACARPRRPVDAGAAEVDTDMAYGADDGKPPRVMPKRKSVGHVASRSVVRGNADASVSKSECRETCRPPARGRKDPYTCYGAALAVAMSRDSPTLLDDSS